MVCVGGNSVTAIFTALGATRVWFAELYATLANARKEYWWCVYRNPWFWGDALRLIALQASAITFTYARATT